MSQYLENMKIGDTIDFRGPLGRLVYNGRGNFSIKLLRKEPPVPYQMKKVQNSQDLILRRVIGINGVYFSDERSS